MVLALLLQMVTACGGSDRAPVSDLAQFTPSIQPSKAVAPRAMPLDRWGKPTDQEVVLLSRLDRVTVARCMSAKGLIYPDPSVVSARGSDQPTTQATDPPAFPGTEPWGLTNPAYARLHGYAVWAPSSDPAGPTPRQAGYVAALAGTNDEPGCAAQSSPLYERAYRYVDRNVVGELGVAASQATAGNARVRRALVSWSACMAEHGQLTDDPLEFARTTGRSASPDRAKQLALVDVTCKSASALTSTIQQAQAAYQKQLIHQHRRELAAYRAGYLRLLALARVEVGDDQS